MRDQNFIEKTSTNLKKSQKIWEKTEVKKNSTWILNWKILEVMVFENLRVLSKFEIYTGYGLFLLLTKKNSKKGMKKLKYF